MIADTITRITENLDRSSRTAKARDTTPETIGRSMERTQHLGIARIEYISPMLLPAWILVVQKEITHEVCLIARFVYRCNSLATLFPPPNHLNRSETDYLSDHRGE